MHPKDKAKRRRPVTDTVASGRRKLFWAYVEKNRGVGGSRKGGCSTTANRSTGRSSAGYVDIGSNNVRRWELLKDTHGYVSDCDFATFLLDGLTEQTESARASSATSNKKTSGNDGDGDIGGDGRGDHKDGGSGGERDWSTADDDDTAEEGEQGGGTVPERTSEVADDFQSSSDEDQSEESEESASEDERDIAWTPASFLCETQFTCQSIAVDSDTPRQASRSTRARLRTGSPSENEIRKRKRSPSALKSPGEKTVRQKQCIDCNQKHAQGHCPLRIPVAIIADTPVERDDARCPLAHSTIPKVLKFDTVDKRHGLSILAVENIAKYTQFGPLVGERIKEPDIHKDMDFKHIWEVFGSNFKLYVDTTNEKKSNWLRYMRPATSKSELNVSVIAKEDELYFVTTKNVEAGIELLYWVEDPTWSWPKTTPVKTSCHLCSKRFCHPLYYRMHCVIFHDPNCGFTVRKFRCKICGIAVLGREALRQHASEMHDGKGAYQCQYCRKFFIRDTSMEVHRTYHCKLNPRRCWPLCDLCGKKFSNPHKLKEHIRRMHSDNSEVLKEFQCKSCSKLMSSSTSLQRHMKEVHKQDQNVASTCDRCGKIFRNMSNLKIHMLTHSGVKPFQCTENDCTAAFTTKQCLQFHYKKIHGYTTDSMPAIERCVAYTFENYAGGEESGD